MSLIEEIKQATATEEQKRDAIKEEIVSFFREYLNSEKFMESMKNQCQKAIECYGHNYTSIDVKFWAYHDGCSATHFRVGSKGWKNPENSDGWDSRRYKGVELCQLQDDIGTRLVEMTKSKLIELGFKISSVMDKESWYYHKEITLSW